MLFFRYNFYFSIHRFSEDSASALSPPSARSQSPSPISLSQPSLSPSPTPASQYPNWGRAPSPQPQIPAQPPRSHSPLSPTSYSPYPTSPKHRPVYRTKALEFQFIPSRESRKAESHLLQRRRAPSPLISPSERPKVGPPRPSSLPLLPTSPLYSAIYDLRRSITPPSPGNPLGDPYFSPSPPLFAPSGAPPPPNSTLVVSRSLSPTHFLSGTSSPPLHPLPPPPCLSYPHLPPPSPTKPFASKPLPYWTKYDVADWLGYLNLGEHRERFLDNEIDGTHLPSLTKDDFLDLGVTRVGHRMNIERALRTVMDRYGCNFRQNRDCGSYHDSTHSNQHVCFLFLGSPAARSPFPFSHLGMDRLRGGGTTGAGAEGANARHKGRERTKPGLESTREEDTTAAIHGGSTQQTRGWSDRKRKSSP